MAAVTTTAGTTADRSIGDSASVAPFASIATGEEGALMVAAKREALGGGDASDRAITTVFCVATGAGWKAGGAGAGLGVAATTSLGGTGATVATTVGFVSSCTTTCARTGETGASDARSAEAGPGRAVVAWPGSIGESGPVLLLASSDAGAPAAAIATSGLIACRGWPDTARSAIAADAGGTIDLSGGIGATAGAGGGFGGGTTVVTATTSVRAAGAGIGGWATPPCSATTCAMGARAASAGVTEGSAAGADVARSIGDRERPLPFASKAAGDAPASVAGRASRAGATTTDAIFGAGGANGIAGLAASTMVVGAAGGLDTATAAGFTGSGISFAKAGISGSVSDAPVFRSAGGNARPVPGVVATAFADAVESGGDAGSNGLTAGAVAAATSGFGAGAMAATTTDLLSG